MHKYKTHVIQKGTAGKRTPPEMILSKLIKKSFADAPAPVLIAIGGPGGTGKTSFSGRLCSRLPDTVILTLDDYKTARAVRQKQNLFGAHPDANQMDLIGRHLGMLKQNETIQKPIYNSQSGKADTTVHFEPARFILVEGEVSTYRLFRDLIDFSIFIDSDWRTQLATRTDRDIEARNYTPDKAIATFLQSNLREFTAHGAESKNWADVHLYCQSDYRLVIESVASELFDSVETILKKHLHTIELTGLIVPVLTPFDADGKINQKMFIEHLEFLASAGVKRILLNVETGESFSLTSRQQKNLLALACEYFPGVVLFCPNAQSLEQTLTQVRWANDTGVDGIWVTPPTGIQDCSIHGLIEYLKHIEESAQSPIILSDNRKTLHNAVNCYAVHDKTGNLTPKSNTQKNFIHETQNILASTRKGAIGFVAPSANFIPELFVRMEKTLTRNNVILAKKYQKQITTLTNSTQSNTVVKLKYALSKRLGDYPTHVRVPLTTPNQQQLDTFIQSLKQIPYCVKRIDWRKHKNKT